MHDDVSDDNLPPVEMSAAGLAPKKMVAAGRPVLRGKCYFCKVCVCMVVCVCVVRDWLLMVVGCSCDILMM